MVMFCKAMASILLYALSLTLLGWRVEGQGNGRSKKEVSGQATLYLGQERDIWRPLMHTTVNLSEISSIKSSFQVRTFDPEGTLFYGDTKNGEDWFVLSLKDGIPMMQIRKADVFVSVAGGPKLNDGKWHTLEVSNRGKFVILGVDGSGGLGVGLQSVLTEQILSSELRLAVGGILINENKLIVQFDPHMDGCVREGNWLNLSIPWESEVEELWPCYQNIQPGSYFPGNGLAIFNTSVFPIEADHVVKIEFWGDFSQMNGTILSFKAPGHEPVLVSVVNNNTNEITVIDGKEAITTKNTFKTLEIMFKVDSLQVQEDDKPKNTTVLMTGDSLSVDVGYLAMWKEGRLSIGGLLGEGDDSVGSQFLTGCLEKIQIQGRDLDLDLGVKHTSISSYSCPA